MHTHTDDICFVVFPLAQNINEVLCRKVEAQWADQMLERMQSLEAKTDERFATQVRFPLAGGVRR